MMNNDTLNQILGLTGLILGIISIIYAIYQTRVFSKGVKITSLLHIRSLINRMEEEKKDTIKVLYNGELCIIHNKNSKLYFRDFRRHSKFQTRMLHADHLTVILKRN